MNPTDELPEAAEAAPLSAGEESASNFDITLGAEGEGETTEVSGLPRQIGDYDILGELGRGGMGVVYKARQRSLNRLVAIKMILASGFAGHTQKLRFQREAEVIAALKHPHIVTIYEISVFEGMPYYCMEFIEGTTLKELISGTPLDWKDAAKFAQTISSAMAFAHERGVVHRDLKPHNVMVDIQRHLHVTDFGLAQDANSESELTVSGAALGTPNYMSPEQATGDTTLINASTDIYAIGAILYEMMTSIPPFQGSNLQDILDKVRHAEPVAPRLINSSIPTDLNTVCLKCLEKSPAARYSSAAELAEELERVLQDLPIKAKPISPVGKALRWCRRNRTLASVIIGSILIIVLGTLLAFFFLNQRRVEAEQARQQAVLKEQEADTQRKRAETALTEAEASRLKAEELT